MNVIVKGRKIQIAIVGCGRISKNHFGSINKHQENTPIFCSSCKNRIATVKKINGKFVNKLNQGQVGLIRKK